MINKFWLLTWFVMGMFMWFKMIHKAISDRSVVLLKSKFLDHFFLLSYPWQLRWYTYIGTYLISYYGDGVTSLFTNAKHESLPNFTVGSKKITCFSFNLEYNTPISFFYVNLWQNHLLIDFVKTNFPKLISQI